MNSAADIGLPSTLQKVVAIMCWMARSLPSASLIMIFWRAGGSSSSAGSGSPGAAPGPRQATRGGLDGLQGLAVPLGIAEVLVGLHEIVDREVVLALEQAGAAADDLLELDHRLDRAHQDDVADVAGVDAGRELLRRGQDGRDGLLVVLEGAQELVAQRAISAVTRTQ